MIENKNLINRILKNGGLFIVLIIVTFYFIFRKIDIKSLIYTISQIKVVYLVPAVGSMFTFILCEALNTKRNIIALGYKTTLMKCINYSVYGFFFSSITPSASGGQPMQVYRMHKDNIKIAHSTLVLFVELLFFQTVTILFAVIGFFTQYSLLLKSIGSIKYLLVIGLMFNLIILIALILTIFSYSTVSKTVDFSISILRICGFSKADIISEKIYAIISDYRECSSYIMRNKRIIIKTFITVCVQIFSLHSVPYWVYRSFGLNEYSIFLFIGVQAVLFIAVSALPLPGAVGASESGFLMLFKMLFPIPILGEAMLISRGISFYLFLLLTGIFILVTWLIKYKKYSKVERIAA